jgi:hypothetical protein
MIISKIPDLSITGNPVAAILVYATSASIERERLFNPAKSEIVDVISSSAGQKLLEVVS